MRQDEGQAAVELQPIGVIHSGWDQPQGTPIQPRMAEGAGGWVDLFEPYAEGLGDIEGFERIWLIYHFHRTSAMKLTVTPFLDTQSHGVLATRSPARPNGIGMSCVRLVACNGRRLELADVDIVDGTPLLDIKPYVPKFDRFDVDRCGWIDAARASRSLADDRFA
ncbi:MAG: tRNA (N6-threonylcarbamoyladenosine(37)-N6)-methyltransferase TrmO [Phycisphaerae bacterium]